jgi:hypothetical protein
VNVSQIAGSSALCFIAVAIAMFGFLPSQHPSVSRFSSVERIFGVVAVAGTASALHALMHLVLRGLS